MGRMNNKYTQNKSIWVKNNIKPFDENKFSGYEKVIITELPGIHKVQIHYDGDQTFMFSFDGEKEGNVNSKVGQYLQKFVYQKISNLLSEKLFHIPMNLFGYLNNKGFHCYDIYINKNFLDYDLIQELLEDTGINYPSIIYSGEYRKSPEIKGDLIIRRLSELPGERLIFYNK